MSKFASRRLRASQFGEFCAFNKTQCWDQIADLAELRQLY